MILMITLNNLMERVSIMTVTNDNTKQLVVRKDRKFGNEHIYPVCNKAQLFAIISGHKTLLPAVIHNIKRLGYTIITKGETI